MTTHSHSSENANELPGQHLDAARMPGHWLLARLGKRVLRPGGLELTRRMLAGLRIGRSDHVVEFAPGLGVTARMTLAADPATYTGVERDASAAEQVRRWLGPVDSEARPRRALTGQAQKTGLAPASASVVYGEAMLSMQTDAVKRDIVREAFRLLRPGGRYGIHELCLAPGEAGNLEAIRADITRVIHHRAVPLTGPEWKDLLRSEGFEIADHAATPMALLEPGRLIRDEGWGGALRFLWRLLRDRAARARVAAMRRTFRQHRQDMEAICLVARKPEAATTG